jgi:hypothetical protein
MTFLASQWSQFRAGLAQLVNRGVGRRNIGADYLLRLRQALGRGDPGGLRGRLAAASTPHPFDAHRTLAERAAALGLDEKSGIASVLPALQAPVAAHAALEAIETEVTRTDLDYTRVPGHPIKIAEGMELPAELAAV